MSAAFVAGQSDRFCADPERSYTLPAHYSYQPEIYAREMEAIFSRTWQYVGHAERVRHAGSYVVTQVANESLVILRGSDGTLRAFYNVCAHRGHRLLRDSGNIESIVCPYHAWSYHLDGRLRHARNSDRVAGFDPDAICLKQVQVEEFLSFVFVNLDPDATSLKRQTGELDQQVREYAPRLGELTLAHRRGYEIEANWKNIIENYSECYHCPKSHPGFTEQVVDIDSYRIEVRDAYHWHHSRAKPPEQGAYGFDPAASDHAQEFSSWYLWPNLAIEVYPGGCLNLFHVVPVGPERSVQYIEWYFYDAQCTAEQKEIIDYLHRTVRIEDQTICESVQRGLHSRAYQQGRLVVDPQRSAASEHGVHHFQRLVWRALHEAPVQS